MNPDPITAYWWQSNNFGDNLTPWMINRIAGRRPMWVDHVHDLPYQLWAGSILNWANKRALVWGAGLGSISDPVNPEVQIRAVRGPLSAMRAKMCGAKVPDVMGDPALCLPRLIPKPEKGDGLIAVVPHYIEQWKAFEIYSRNANFKLVDVTAPVDEVVREIASARLVLSSSLHGLIVAHAYGVPAAWVKYSNGLCGDGTKFVDHLALMGQIKVGDWATPFDLREDFATAHSVPFWEANCQRAYHFDDARLQAACPIPWR